MYYLVLGFFPIRVIHFMYQILWVVSLVLEELEAFAQVLDAPVRPVCAILGGAKVCLKMTGDGEGERGENWNQPIFFFWREMGSMGCMSIWVFGLNVNLSISFWVMTKPWIKQNIRRWVELISGEWQDPVDQEHAGQGSQDCVVMSLT